MRFWTIWTVPAMTLRERFRRTWDEWFLFGLARRLPARLSYWAVIDAGAHASTGEFSNQVVPEMTFFDVLERHPGAQR